MSRPVRITEKATPAVLRERNTELVLQSVLAGGGTVSRADIARSTGLARAVVSQIMEGLVARRLVVEETARPSGRGKPATLLRIDTGRHCLLMADVRPAEVLGGVVGLDGAIGATARTALPARPGGADVVAALVPMLRTLARDDGRAVLSAGVAVPGIVSPEQRVIEALQLRWKDVDLAGPLAGALGHEVVLVNDATAVGMSELSVQSRAGDSVIVLHIAGGIGSAVLLDGRVHLGERQRAGEVGHIDVGVSDRRCECGRRGCLETVASLPAVLDGAPVEELDAVSSPGDAPATPELEALAARVDYAGKSLAALLCVQAAILDIGDVVIDGPVRRAGERLLDAIERELAVRLPPSDVRRPRFSTMAEHSIMHGAAATAMHHRLGVIWHSA
ncbi:putative NBD/HSP70 family sugar kinase [Actinomadura luteofluorescens]|uniref:Putative NBD/HSP70 family sugar kinase n=2 Tax=Actinomadura luteofluorescens TaxID=46163 RepID=A0A7Y9JFB3_9ACTN|nr:ROK family transcriptional regulator [Actinomadura luteofluorescens]NYD46433.1 putative NBD/HSP70 family sugar kinase [Actinomadura luteofluorescens]